MLRELQHSRQTDADSLISAFARGVRRVGIIRSLLPLFASVSSGLE